MNQRDAAICEAVWALWARAINPTLRLVADVAGLPGSTAVLKRLGRDGHNPRRRNLISEGWLRVDEGRTTAPDGTLRPGPRFLGLDRDGWPLDGASYE